VSALNFAWPQLVKPEEAGCVAINIRKLIRMVLATLLAILLVMISGAFGYRAYRQHASQQAMIINTGNGIDEAMFVNIGGIDQWLTIRGRNRSNPVVLMIHGGPGVSNSAFALQLLPYETDFTIVQWDQPGTAKTFARAGGRIDSGLTIRAVARDGINVAEFLTAHLHKPKVILLGWSWGSVIAIEMLRKRPDLFSAYVGTGQIVNERVGEALAYAGTLKSARARGDRQAVRELESSPPPYMSQAALGTQRKWSSIYAGDSPPLFEIARSAFFAPRYSLSDVWHYMAGLIASQDHFMGPSMNGEFMNINLMAANTVFEVPMFIVQGTNDMWTPAELSRAFLAALTAPEKEFIPIEGAGHTALVTNASAFLEILNSRVRP
jgi:pimeloyl-ACP methyl ester carboxylesterase